MEGALFLEKEPKAQRLFYGKQSVMRQKMNGHVTKLAIVSCVYSIDMTSKGLDMNRLISKELWFIVVNQDGSGFLALAH
jgi:hypothetical protein